MTDSQALLSIENLSLRLPAGSEREFAIRNISLTLAPNEVVCVVGESGSGKSMMANAIVRLTPPDVGIDGAIRFHERDLTALPGGAIRRIRGAEIGMIFQEPMTALNPIQTIGTQISEMFRLHTGLSRSARRNKTLEVLEQVQIADPARTSRAYPHQLSGGQRQRAMIAMAIALSPKLLIADEPTTALDVTTQAQILKLIRELQHRNRMGVLFITHDFGVVADIADRVVVMQSGLIVEQGSVDDVLNTPQHPYTRKLIAAVPTLEPRRLGPASGEIILRLEHLSKVYKDGGQLFGRSRVVHGLRDVNLSLAKGSSVGIVGESGSGKSTLARCIVRLLKPDAGSIQLRDIDYGALNRIALRRESHRVQMVFQDPSASLNPKRKVGDLIGQGLVVRGVSRQRAWRRAEELLEMVKLEPAAANRFPHEFSGGQRQRIGLARALAVEPEILVADEPVSALDVSVQAQVLALFADLRAKLSLSLLFITHDLRVAANICDEIAVMKDGEIVEYGETSEVFAKPRHPYTRMLLESVPGRKWRPLDTRTSKDWKLIPSDTGASDEQPTPPILN